MRPLFSACLLVLATSVALADDASGKPGAGLYATHCVACHQPDGQGQISMDHLYIERRHPRGRKG